MTIIADMVAGQPDIFLRAYKYEGDEWMICGTVSETGNTQKDS